MTASGWKFAPISKKHPSCDALLHWPKKPRVAPVRFGYGSGVERFERFRFSVPAVPLQKGFFCISVHSLTGKVPVKLFRFLENGSGGSGSAFGFGKNGSDGSGSDGSGSAPEPACFWRFQWFSPQIFVDFQSISTDFLLFSISVSFNQF